MQTYGIFKTLDDRIREHTPDPRYKKYIANALCSINAAEANDWKRMPFGGDDTLYDLELSKWSCEKADLEKDKARLQKQYDALLDKLADEDEKDQPAPEEQPGSEEEKSVPEAAVVEEIVIENGRKQKGRPQVACRRTQNADAKRAAMQSKSVKSSLATVQTELIQLNREIEDLEEKIKCYKHYQQVSLETTKRLTRAVQQYKDSKDRWFLEQRLSLIYETWDTDMRKYKGDGTCCGGGGDFCEMHLLPLSTRPLWQGSNVTLITKCALGPKENEPVWQEDDGSAW